ncbi:hypothetical protein [Mesorhizobium sp. B4-1-1]|uniref:GIY-YIG nuclease family protein n=1 Tax=Mesorhizobium sp. B4-1-1 TaxID=2589890 RepID=UPI00112AF69F|nr:hypothetical protein [Mesorhizobium sp. B4-1-1]TPI22532.1 hypothetical protein FJW10_03655 [Mesorhizobium sp. B4-1-1]
MHKDISFLDDGFSLVTGASLQRFPEAIPAFRGIFILFVKDGQEILRKSNCNVGDNSSYCGVGYFHLFTGQTFDLRQELQQHLVGMALTSAFKTALIALQYEHLSIWPEMDALMGIMDRKLGLFLKDNLLVAYKHEKISKNGEADLIERLGGPLNLGSKFQRAQLANLKALQQKFREEMFGPVFPV